MPNQAGINFNDNTYKGKNVDNVYHGYNGLAKNPQSSASEAARGDAMTQSFRDAARNTQAGYNGVVHNPQTSSAAKENAAAKSANMPKWRAEGGKRSGVS